VRADNAASPEAPAARAAWTDSLTGVTEEATLLEVAGQRIIAFVHRPAGTARAGVLLCGSLYGDLQVNYRREVLLCRELAGRGIAAARFHYRGTGNSDALPDGVLRFESMLEDARTAAAFLTEGAGTERVAFYGAKLGALVCARLADEADAAPMVLEAPAVSGADYFRQLSRADRVAGLRSETGRADTDGSLEHRFAAVDVTEVLGHPVHRASFEDLRSRQLEPKPAPGRRILLVQVAASEKLGGSYERLAARLGAAGAHVEALVVRGRQLWFVPDAWAPETESPEVRTIIDGIASWVVRVCGG
jgi:predicted alpha/beta-hydrolase family hydrolase